MLGGRWEALGGFAVFCKSGGQKIEKKNFFFRFSCVCACCDGVISRSEMSIFDPKYMCQFLYDF